MRLSIGSASSFLIIINNTNKPIHLPTKQLFQTTNMSGLMDKAKDSLSGNKAAQGFADKQVNSRSYPPLVPFHDSNANNPHRG